MEQRPPGIGSAAAARSSAVSSDAISALIGRLVRPARPGRRHRPRPQLADDLLPHLGVFTGRREIQRVERQLAAGRRSLWQVTQ